MTAHLNDTRALDVESANMLIMALAHAQISGDTSLIQQHVCSFVCKCERVELILFEVWPLEIVVRLSRQ